MRFFTCTKFSDQILISKEMLQSNLRIQSLKKRDLHIQSLKKESQEIFSVLCTNDATSFSEPCNVKNLFHSQLTVQQEEVTFNFENIFTFVITIVDIFKSHLSSVWYLFISQMYGNNLRKQNSESLQKEPPFKLVVLSLLIFKFFPGDFACSHSYQNTMDRGFCTVLTWH